MNMQDKKNNDEPAEAVAHYLDEFAKKHEEHRDARTPEQKRATHHSKNEIGNSLVKAYKKAKLAPDNYSIAHQKTTELTRIK
jgi:hypothetical protein